VKRYIPACIPTAVVPFRNGFPPLQTHDGGDYNWKIIKCPASKLQVTAVAFQGEDSYHIIYVINACINAVIYKCQPLNHSLVKSEYLPARRSLGAGGELCKRLTAILRRQGAK